MRLDFTLISPCLETCLHLLQQNLSALPALAWTLSDAGQPNCPPSSSWSSSDPVLLSSLWLCSFPCSLLSKDEPSCLVPRLPELLYPIFFFKLELYNIVFVSAVLSWVCFMYTHNPSLLDRPQPPAQPQIITKHRAKLPVLQSSSPVTIFHPVCIYHMSVLLSQFTPPSFSGSVSILYVCVFIPALQIGSSVPFF